MLYMKLSGGLLLVVCGTLAGLYCSQKLKGRLAFYEQYIRFLTQISSAIGYTAANVRTLFEGVQGLPLIDPLLKGTEAGLDRGEDFPTAWKKAVSRWVSDKNDRKLLYYFGATFGTDNCAGELAKLSLHRESAVSRQAELREEYHTKRRLYRVVGMFCGTLTAVLLL